MRLIGSLTGLTLDLDWSSRGQPASHRSIVRLPLLTILSKALEVVRSPEAECGVLLLPRTPKQSERASARKKAFRKT
jgi:hypothetical protein